MGELISLLEKLNQQDQETLEKIERYIDELISEKEELIHNKTE